ncbi:HD domain-containing phosphohydrolase [Alkalihalobacterium sp. APHAB7]|uniref:HD domain-containing phosphohydrolase n=1 Tax=Alkalihalobacterium sp. APHAB7 TaxID=3402081 RepID=UPI003AAC8FD9
MTTYRTFIKLLLRNYIIGSLVSVFGVGTVLMFTTIALTRDDIPYLLFVVFVSFLIMLACEFISFERHIRPIRIALIKDAPSLEELKKAYIQTHKFPKLTGIRILGPHLLGLSIPAIAITHFLIANQYLEIPFEYIFYGCAAAVLIASIHAMLEYFQTSSAIIPVLEELRNKGKIFHDIELSLEGQVLVSIRTKFQLSALLIGALPLMLFSLATFVRFSDHSNFFMGQYWLWAAIILTLGIALSLYGAWLLFSTVMSPIQHLRNNMKQVESGNFTIKASDTYSDEFSNLINGFNHMVRGLNDRQKLNEQLLESFFATLAAALDARDHYTAGHSLRVAHYSIEIGKKANLSEKELLLLKKTALLHDIGKIGIPDRVLLKAGKLTEDEFRIIQQHSVLGEEILKQVQPSEMMKPFLPGVRSHHERVDGKGYPDQLIGEEIPILGRIIAVADAFDAMTSDRPYRKGMPPQKALAILKSGRGTQWESEFVDHIAEWLEEQNYSINKEEYRKSPIKTG